MRALLLLLLLLPAGLAHAQVTDTNPFPMLHPTTGERGAWVPEWQQVEQLKIDSELRECSKLLQKREQTLRFREEEIRLRIAALSDEQQASAALALSLAEANRKTEEAEHATAVRTWLLGSVGIVAATLAVVFAVN